MRIYLSSCPLASPWKIRISAPDGVFNTEKPSACELNKIKCDRLDIDMIYSHTNVTYSSFIHYLNI